MKKYINFLFLLVIFVFPLFSQSTVWYQTTAYDFSLGLFSNIELVSPDPDGMDDGALRLVASDTIRVLQIYPDRFDTLLVAQALETYAPLGTPPLNLRVFIIPLSIFNRLTSESTYVTVRDPLTLETVRLRIVDFDILFFGIADSYGSSAGTTDLTPSAAEIVRRFARLAKGVIFSHDTIWAISLASHPNFNSLSDISGLSARPIPWTVFTYVKRVATDISNPVLNVPFILPERFEVTSCHQTGQYVVDGQTWYVGTDASGTADYGIYWHTYHNPEYDSYGAYFSYGHVSLPPREWEAKAMINSIYYSYHGGRGIGVYTSPVYDAMDTISLWRVSWSADIPFGSSMSVEVRSAYEPGRWREWEEISMGEVPSPIEGRLFQYRVQMTKDPIIGGLPILHWIMFEFILPFITAEILSPPVNIISSCETQTIEIRLSTNSMCRVDTSSIYFSINGRRIPYGIELALANDSTLVYTPISQWRDNETIIFSLDSVRNNCGGRISEPLYGRFTIDISPPSITGERPRNGSLVAESSPIISCTITDNLSGVDTTSISLTINDTMHFTPGEPGDPLQYVDSQLIFSPSSIGLTFSEFETVRVRIDPVSDMAELCGKNTNSGRDWYFVVVIVDLWFSDTTASIGDTILIPVYTEPLGELNVNKFSIKIPLDTLYIRYIDIVSTGSATDRWGTITSTYRNDTLTVSGISSSQLPSNPVLFYIKARIPHAAVPGGYTHLGFAEVSLNDGELGTKTRDGLLIVRQQPISWMVDIQVNQSGMLYPFTLTFGAASSGSDMFDPGLDRIFIPQSPGTSIGYFKLDDPNYPHIRFLQRDIRSNTAPELEWHLKTSGNNGYIQWEIGMLPPGIFSVNSIYDMRTTNLYNFSPNEEITITYRNRESIPAEITIYNGWNLISFPAIPVGGVEQVLGTPHIFSYNSILRRYERTSIPEDGKGYFVLGMETGSFRYAGRAVESFRLLLSRGWNLIGAPMRDEPLGISSIVTIPEGLIISPLYTYNPTSGRYEPSTVLEKGKGYWLLSSGDGILIVGE